MTAQTPTSPRLRWRRLCAAELDTFHRLALDPHIRRYLLDGETVDRAWCAATLAASDALFDRLGLGLWLLSHRDGTDGIPDGTPHTTNSIDDTLGFAGYHIFDGMGDNAQLLYALVEPATGRGLATEAAHALVTAGHAAGLDPIHSAVDGPNAASLRVLAKAGFTIDRTTPTGHFGETVWLTHTPR